MGAVIVIGTDIGTSTGTSTCSSSGTGTGIHTRTRTRTRTRMLRSEQVGGSMYRVKRHVCLPLSFHTNKSDIKSVFMCTLVWCGSTVAVRRLLLWAGLKTNYYGVHFFYNPNLPYKVH